MNLYVWGKNPLCKYFNENNNNLRKIWDGIKELVNIKPKNRESINCIVFNKKNVTDPTEIANAFNTYFTIILMICCQRKNTMVINIILNISLIHYLTRLFLELLTKLKLNY